MTDPCDCSECTRQLTDDEFRSRLSELLHERRYGPAGMTVTDKELARLVEELVEKVRSIP